MKKELIEFLICPKTGQKLSLINHVKSQDHIITGNLISEDKQYSYLIKDGIPRFVPESNYADNFGMQWNHFSKTQLDSHSGKNISSERFWMATNWSKDDVKGKWVLDVGCGSGRFAEVALNAGAKVVAIDYSTAVDACYQNLIEHPNIHIVQADIYALPFLNGSFDFVYSLGVLQHTPDVFKAFSALPPMLEPGGKLCVDYYEYSWRSFFMPKYWLRPITKHISKPILFNMLKKLVPFLLWISRLISFTPFFGAYLKRLIPVANYYGTLPLNKKQHSDWSLLDTFDWLSPAYDNPQKKSVVRGWMEKAGFSNIEVLKAGHLVTRGNK